MRFSGRRFSILLSLGLVILSGLTAACSNGDVDAVDDSRADPIDQPTVAVDESAPDPILVEVDDLQLIDEWEAARIPRFRDGEVLDFDPHASTIENGGTLLLDGDHASAGEIIGFYRGALRVLDFEERWVNATELNARSDEASIMISVTEFDDRTQILMILTDAPRGVER